MYCFAISALPPYNVYSTDFTLWLVECYLNNSEDKSVVLGTAMIGFVLVPCVICDVKAFLCCVSLH